MARRIRVEEIGFYHIINRGVEQRDIFLDVDDRGRFIEIVDESAMIYKFIMHSYCLMDNHYHFLLETTERNLSLLMRQINSKYSIYFNKKYKRVGPLWQGRFKSWPVFDDSYLFSLVKYIECNPVKAGITQKVGEYQFASSCFLQKENVSTFNMQCLNLGLIASLNSSSGLLGLSDNIIKEKDEEYLSKIYHAKFRKDDEKIVRIKKKALSEYNLLAGDKKIRNENIFQAVFDGYKQSELAAYLGVSSVLISKLLKHHRIKIELFEKLKSRGLFWSYAKNISYQQLGDDVLCETLLKYGEFYDLKIAFDIFGLKFMKKVWQAKLVDDQRFIRLNLFLARVLFSMDVESNYFKEVKSVRGEKLRLLAGRHAKSITHFN